MQPVIYSMSVSADGYVAGPDGDISWTVPDAELLSFHNDQERQVSTHLLGRRLYEEMLVWHDISRTGIGPAVGPGTGPAELEFASIWMTLPKVVFSRTLTSVTADARLASADLATEVASAVASAGSGVVAVGGAGLAASLIARDLVDEYRMFVRPVVLGGGTPYFPPLDKPLGLDLVEQRTFGSRAVYLRYRRTRG